jgi:histidine phosphotransferase ChpT
MDPFRTIFAPGGVQESPPPGQRAITSSIVDTRVTALLCARLCHELIGPIAAIDNGTELLADEDLDFAHDAVELIGVSARQAANRLQFYRFAYGFSGGAVAAGAQPRDLATRLFGGSRITCEYGESAAVLPLDWQKLACNLLLVGADALPRGGRLVLATAILEIEAIGETPSLSPETLAALTLAVPVHSLTSRTVQAYYAGVLAASLGCRLVGRAEPRRVRLAAVIPAH